MKKEGSNNNSIIKKKIVQNIINFIVSHKNAKFKNNFKNFGEN